MLAADKQENKREKLSKEYKVNFLLLIIVQLLTHVQLFATPWTAAHQASLPFTTSQEFAQTHVHWVTDAAQPSHPLTSPSLPTFNFSQD